MAAPAAMSKLKPPESAQRNASASASASPPRAMHDLPPVEDRTHIVRERTFASTVGVDEVIRALFAARATGQLVINLSRGVISGTMTFEERQRIVPDADAAEPTT